jgi:hypothetical protein
MAQVSEHPHGVHSCRTAYCVKDQMPSADVGSLDPLPQLLVHIPVGQRRPERAVGVVVAVVGAAAQLGETPTRVTLNIRPADDPARRRARSTTGARSGQRNGQPQES